MNCPVCSTPLSESVRQNISLLVCGQGHGMWLSTEAAQALASRSDEDMHTLEQKLRPGSATMKHARRDEDWLDYYPEGQTEGEGNRSTITQILLG